MFNESITFLEVRAIECLEKKNNLYQNKVFELKIIVSVVLKLQTIKLIFKSNKTRKRILSGWTPWNELWFPEIMVN